VLHCRQPGQPGHLGYAGPRSGRGAGSGRQPGHLGDRDYTYNTGPALLFAAPPGGEVGVAYGDQLAVTGGTSGGTVAETIPAGNAVYDISELSQTMGSATFTSVPATDLSTAPQAVVSATNVGGDTFAAWDPLIVVYVPPTAVGGTYTATITHSVS
jgi:hypothetical protein